MPRRAPLLYRKEFPSTLTLMADTTTPSSNMLQSKVDATSPRFEKNMRAMAEITSEIHNQEGQLKLGGGTKAIESQHAKKRLTARERIALLIDPGSKFQELGLYAAYEMYEEWGGAPSAGVVTGLGRVHGRLFMLIVNDATVKAGAFFRSEERRVGKECRL